MKSNCDNRALRAMLVAKQAKEDAWNLYSYLCQTCKDDKKIAAAREVFQSKNAEFIEKERISMSSAS